MKEQLRKILEREEGVKYEVYLDHLGIPTCGVGHMLIPEDEEHGCEVGTPVSEERVAALEADKELLLKKNEQLRP